MTISSFSPNSRRGISSVVGALIFTVLMIAGFSAMSLALDSQTDIVNTQRVVADIELKKQQEQFGVAVFTDANNILNVSVDNNGQNPVEISRIWITNKTLATQPAKPFSVNSDDAFVPTGFISNVLSSQPLYMIPDTYDVKVISTLGTVKITEFTVGTTSSGLRSEMITTPPDVIIGQNVTVAMIVTNIDNDEIKNVYPDDLDFSATGVGAILSSTAHTPAHVDLKPGESVLFSWDYQVTGNSGDILTFSSHAIGDGGKTSNIISDTSILRELTDGGDVGGLEVVITDELFGKPQLFMIMPNTLGDEDTNAIDRPIWGVNIANPTDQPMFVTKVVIIAVAPRATSSDKVFKDSCENDIGKPEKPMTISPTPNKWSCPESNQLMWRDTANPQRVEPRSVFPFLVQIGGGNMGSTLPDAQNILIQPIVFTTLGQFGKAGYGSTMHSSDVALPNVFLARNTQSVNSADIMGELRGIQEGSTVVFNATLADMSNDNAYGIQTNADLIINIPKEWTFNNIISHVGFDTPTTITYPDGSTQISGNLISSIDNHSEAKTIKFTATAPSVSKTKMYVMHILANGLATGNGGAGTFTVGPIAETVLQVCPTSGCP